MEPPKDAFTANVLKAYLVALQGGSRPTHRQLREFAGHERELHYVLGDLCEGGYLTQVPTSTTWGLYKVHPEAWAMYDLTPPAWRGGPESQLKKAAPSVRAAFEAIKTFFDNYHHLPTPSELIGVIGNNRQRVHQILVELRYYGCLPPKR